MHLRIDDEISSILKAKASFFGYRAKGRDSVVGLLKAIALQEMSLVQTEEIEKLIQELIKNNRYQLAEALANIAYLHFEQKPIIQQIKRKIHYQLPFRLSYVDAAGKAFIFDCDYGQISTYENKQYLEVSFTNEVGGNAEVASVGGNAGVPCAYSTPTRRVESDSPEPLKTNRCLRLDRVPENSRIEDLSDLEWGELNYIDVSFKLFGNLAYSYQQQPDDRTEAIEDGILVTRKISNDFFFLRQILRYGDKCQIISPDFMIDALVANLQSSLERYNRNQ